MREVRAQQIALGRDGDQIGTAVDELLGVLQSADDDDPVLIEPVEAEPPAAARLL